MMPLGWACCVGEEVDVVVFDTSVVVVDVVVVVVVVVGDEVVERPRGDNKVDIMELVVEVFVFGSVAVATSLSVDCSLYCGDNDSLCSPSCSSLSRYSTTISFPFTTIDRFAVVAAAGFGRSGGCLTLNGSCCRPRKSMAVLKLSLISVLCSCSCSCSCSSSSSSSPLPSL